MIFGQHELNTLDQFDTIRKGQAVRAALMADGHYGYVMPVGGVAAYRNAVSVIGVGFDIACGNCAIKTNLKLEDITRQKLNVKDITGNPHYVVSDKYLSKFADDIEAHISFGIGRSNLADDAPTDHAMFLDPRWYIIPNIGAYRDDLRDKARKQLGTVGSGNHYVDVFVDRADGTIWVGVHFGSRGLGHTIATNYLAIGQGGTWGDRGKELETILDLDTQDGKDYWDLMNLAGDYAYAGREWVTRKVVELLGGEVVDMVHNHHNFAWKETHDIPATKGESFTRPLMNYTSEELVVVRKGATPAFPGQRGFVGGSMGDDAVILEGTRVGSAGHYEDFGLPDYCLETQKDALFSTVHGAGRIMSRTEAAGKWSRSGVQKKRGKVSQLMRDEWLEKTGVVLRGGGLDESPHVYRRLPDVLAAQGDTVTVTNTLKPLIVVMARANERDPYKD
jgi:tRNA-splicing ligase RtcB